MLPKRLLFRFSAPCRYTSEAWTSAGAPLDASYALPDFASMEDSPEPPVDFRIAWNEDGLLFAVYVTGKRQSPWCRTSRPDDSDGLQLWIDTRDVHDVHRATRFCHRFLFMPCGAGSRLEEPTVLWLPINRAKEQPNAVSAESLKVASEVTRDGYRIDGFIPAKSLTGFDFEEHPRLGFTYAIIDREFGEHTFSAGKPLPYKDDPSLWSTLELVRD